MKYTLSFIVFGTYSLASPLTTLRPRSEGKILRVGLQAEVVPICKPVDKCVKDFPGDGCADDCSEKFIENRWYTYVKRKTTEPKLCVLPGDQIWTNFPPEDFKLDDGAAVFRDLNPRTKDPDWPHGHFKLDWCGPDVECKLFRRTVNMVACDSNCPVNETSTKCLAGYYEANGANPGIMIINDGRGPISCNKWDGGRDHMNDHNCRAGITRLDWIECHF